MDPTAFVVIALVALFFGWLAHQQQAAGRAAGKPAEPLRQAIPELDPNGPALVFLYSPRCAPCQRMHPLMERLARDTDRVFLLDITRHPELAHALSIRATPTTLLVTRGQIRKVLLGVVREPKLRRLLEEDA